MSHLTLEMIIVLNQKQQYHARPWFLNSMEEYPTILKFCITAGEREDSTMFYRKNKTKTPNPKKYWNYKGFTTFLCIIKEYSEKNV